MLYIIYLIVTYKYNEYKINTHINNIILLNESLRDKIVYTRETIEYKSSKAYIDKILKQEQNKKNPREIVLFITPEKQFNKYTSNESVIKERTSNTDISQWYVTDNMSVREKWFYFLFQQDNR